MQPASSFILILLLFGSCAERTEKTARYSPITEPALIQTADSASLAVSTIASNLDVPWDITWGPDNWIWYTEQSGSISRVNPATGERKLVLRILPQVFRLGTRGLLCMALHPDFENTPYVVVNYHYMRDRRVKDIWSRWVRYTYDGQTLTDPLILFEETAEAGHNGARVTFAPDGTVLMAVGDGDNNNDELNSGVAQNMEKYGGKVLRMNIDGTIPDDNPFPGSPVWALGFRVPQGLVYASNGKIYTAEHGHNINDEVNLVQKGGNYGYPNVSGVCDEPREMEFCATHNVLPPLHAWTPTVAPAGMDYYHHTAIPEWQNSLLVVTLKTQSLRVLNLSETGDRVLRERVYLTEKFGRLRGVCVSPDGDVYVSTSNRDWNPVAGFPQEKDDRILRITGPDRRKDERRPAREEIAATRATGDHRAGPGAAVYKNYCASCHKADGSGLEGSFPSLRSSAHVQGDVRGLIRVVLEGKSDGGQETDMPGFPFLSDAQVADVVNYVRSSFGPGEESVTPADVRRQRNNIP